MADESPPGAGRRGGGEGEEGAEGEGEEARVEAYERFLSEQLVAAKNAATSRVAEARSKRLDYEGLEGEIIAWRKARRRRVDIGNGVYMQAEVEEDALFLVDIGLGFQLELKDSEVKDVAERLAAYWKKKEERAVEEEAKVITHMQLVGEAVRQLSFLQKERS